MDEHAFESWFRLAHTPGVGRASARALLAAFGTPQAVLDAPAKAWRKVVPRSVADALLDPPADSLLRQIVARDWLQGSPRRTVIPLGDPAYPALLLQTEDPPLLLYADGDLATLAAPAISVVGSRNPTPEGAGNARRFAQQLAADGWVIVSGLARGIDASAHEGALEAGGRTLAVIGTGPDIAYPTSHRGLMRRITEKGLVISEYSPGTPPLPAHFPQRNRIIAGLSRGTLVVEAALQSGSLITARLAAEAGREVFAIPGSIHSPLSKGCHALIQQGAKLVQKAQDLTDELQGAGPVPAVTEDNGAPESPEGGDEPPEAGSAGPAVLQGDPPADTADAGPDDPVLAALGWEPVALDTLCQRTGWPVAELSARLLEHELTGTVSRLAGGHYQRTRRA
jgi:DNA processing protein